MRNTIVAAVVAAAAVGGMAGGWADDRPKEAGEPEPRVVGKAEAGAPAREFQRAFKAAGTSAERRDLAMKACDDGVIRSRMSLEDLKKLFGDSPLLVVYPADEKTGKQSALLRFAVPEPAPATGPFIQEPGHHAWYVLFFFERDSLTLYYLTNCGK